MNESEWLSSTDPVAMLNDLLGLPEATKNSVIRSPLASDRKLRLFAVAAARFMSPPDSQSEEANKLAEEIADGLREVPKPYPAWDVLLKDASWAARNNALEYRAAQPQGSVAAVLRDIFGNPHRPLIRVSPQGVYLGIGILAPDAPWRAWHQAWVTKDAYAIAQTMYEARDFRDAPYLADALEEAGCNIEDALHELRGKVRCSLCLGKGTRPFYGVPYPQNDSNKIGEGPCWGCSKTGWKVPTCSSCSGEGCAQHGHGKPGCDGSGKAPLIHARGNWVVDLVLGRE